MQADDPKLVFQAMRPVFTDLATEVQRSIGYYQALHKDANLTRLIGVGSLHVQQTDGRGHAEDVNMSVPIDLLTPIIDELLTHGRRNRPARPWLGVYSTENAGRVVIADVAETGPAAKAGLRTGDIVASVRDASVDTLGEFYREIWSCGPAGAEIPIELVRDRRSLWVRVRSADRASYLRKPRMN